MATHSRDMDDWMLFGVNDDDAICDSNHAEAPLSLSGCVIRLVSRFLCVSGIRRLALTCKHTRNAIRTLFGFGLQLHRLCVKRLFQHWSSSRIHSSFLATAIGHPVWICIYRCLDNQVVHTSRSDTRSLYCVYDTSGVIRRVTGSGGAAVTRLPPSITRIEMESGMAADSSCDIVRISYRCVHTRSECCLCRLTTARYIKKQLCTDTGCTVTDAIPLPSIPSTSRGALSVFAMLMQNWKQRIHLLCISFDEAPGLWRMLCLPWFALVKSPSPLCDGYIHTELDHDTAQRVHFIRSVVDYHRHR